MNKDNIFKSSKFFMNEDDVLHLLIRDSICDGIVITLCDADGEEEDTTDETTTPAPIEEVKYGLLYNWYAATDVREITNTGWHVPDVSEWQTLSIYLGGNTISGGKLKETGLTYWNNPNTGADNSSKFNGRGSGSRIYNTGSFTNLNQLLACWTTDQMDPTYMYVAIVAFYNLSSSVMNATTFKAQGDAIRPVKDSTTLEHGEEGTYTGNDGKIYRTICIGTQEWLADNLCETKYRNGDDIPEVTDNATWAALISGALCVYNNNWDNL